MLTSVILWVLSTLKLVAVSTAAMIALPVEQFVDKVAPEAVTL
jgi:hypothetical protein